MPRYICPICGIGFQSEGDLGEHNWQEHINRPIF